MKKQADHPSGFRLIEEAVHLLKRAPASAWVYYAMHTAGWTLAVLLSWAYTTWFAPSRHTLAALALALALLYIALQGAQAEFCAHLQAVRTGAATRRFSWRERLGIATQQAPRQVLGLLAMGPALLLALPAGWLWAWMQSLSVLGTRVEERELGPATWKETMRWPKQNHVGLASMTLLAGVVWINVGVFIVVVPLLANRLLAVENPFGLSGWSFLNTTFLASVSMLTWAVMDPLVKAFYVLRVFYGRSVTTGEDLLAEFKPAGRRVRAGAALLGLVFCVLCTPPSHAESTNGLPAATTTVEATKLDQKIEQVLERSEYQWRLRQAPSLEEEERELNWIERLFKWAGKWTGKLAKWCVSVWQSITNWIDGLFPERERSSERAEASPRSMGVLRILLYVILGLLALALIVLVALALAKRRRQTHQVLQARPISIQPDLEDEGVSAEQLPSDGWLALAREKARAGEWRLALRALYLATLAGLAQERFLVLARHKTNQDYERELRRALAPTEITHRFRARRVLFESVWYGRNLADERVVKEWLSEWETSP